ncbi:MAG: zinc-ribbon domain-containing protein, partial [Deltaproteobacteria bacterium]|nr:zinc-ribbon domain-containing protein [Deltaproteobacteria bacterium]
MGEPHRICPDCGASSGDDAKFCGACGRPFAPPDAAGPAFDDRTEVDPSPAVAPVAKKAPAKTMFGMPAVVPDASSTPEPAPQAVAPQAVAPQAVAPQAV